jgi:hypothetical protein
MAIEIQATVGIHEFFDPAALKFDEFFLGIGILERAPQKTEKFGRIKLPA